MCIHRRRTASSTKAGRCCRKWSPPGVEASGFDIGNGRVGHITWDVAEQALRQKFLPDTISSDWTDAARKDQVFDFPNVLSKFLALGMPLDQVIERATIQAAHTFPAFGDLGTLRVGSCRHLRPRVEEWRLRVRRQRQHATQGDDEAVRSRDRRCRQTCEETCLSRADSMSEQPAVCVEAYARLHFGVLDLRGSSGRWFGGIGASASAPSLLLSVSPADTLTVEGDDTDRATAFARRFLEHHHLERGARIRVHRALPSHAGLGSGTQLALSIARALAELHSVDADPRALARAMGRAQRSAIGTWTFAGGGLVVEGGRRARRATSVARSSRGCRSRHHGGASWWYLMVLPASAERTKQRRSHDCRSHPSMTSSASRTWC